MRHIINALLRVGRIKLVDDSGPIQRVQVDEGDLGAYGGRRLVSDVAHILHFGFASAPPIESEVMLAALGGDRSQTIALGTNHQPSRIKGLQPGDSAQYDVRGQFIKLTAAGLEIDCAGLPAVIQNCPTITLKAETSVTIDAPSAHFTGNITADGEVAAQGGAAKLTVLRQAYSVHEHTYSGGKTAGPDTAA